MYRILLVDDEILVRDAIKENIDWKSMDCELVGDCENGKQAADFVKTHPVDIVLTDILMPYMDGMELSHFLHDNYPEIVIVIFSGFGEFEYAKKAIQYNVSEYMLKPVTAMELREVIGKMKEKVDQQRKEKEKLESLTKTSQDYHKNALVIRSKAIEALVGCTRDVQKSLDELARMGIYMDSSSYRVAVFDMDLFSEIHEIDMEKRQESALMAFVLFNVADEIVTGRGAGIAYQEGNNRVCILFMGDHCREFSQETYEICEEIQNKVKEVIGIEVSAGIGGWVKNPEELIRSHEQAENAIGLRYLLGGNLLIDTEEQKEERSLSLQQSLNEMTNGIRNGNLQAVNHALSDMKEKIKNARADKSQACVCLQMILRHAGSCWESVTSGGEDLFHKRELLMGKVTEQKTFDEAFLLAENYVHEVFERCSSMNSSSGQKRTVLAMEYIRAHYMEQELSLNDICSYLNISTSYFSTIFKEATGGTFLEFLSRIRMEKAKELLEQTTLKNYEIAEMVGFSDPHYFSISFKKMTGKTPTEYAREKKICMKKRLMIAGVCVCTLIAAAGLYQNYSKNEKYQKQLFAMDTYMGFTAYGSGGQQAVEKAAQEVQRLDALLSAQNEESQVYALNQRGSLEVSDDLAEIIQRGKEIFQETGGLFDDTIYPLMELWGFPTGEYHVPSREEIENLLPYVDGGTVEISGNAVTLGEGQQIDLGGIAKGYTGEKLTEIFQEYGVSSAMVSLGGNIQAIGTKPDGSSWRVGIRDPKGSQQDYAGVLQVQDEAVVTSGGYERYFEEDSRTYIHIIDPRTGYPVENDLLSVTIVSPDGTLADGLSTALYIMGYDKAVQFWEQHQDEFDVILITADEQIHVSKKLQDSFQSDKNWETIE